MASDQPVITACTGLGGYAGSIVDLLLACQEQPDPPAKLVAVTSSNPAKHPERLAAVQAKGVKLVSTYEELLADKSIQAVWLPLPIDLHRSCTEQALAAGKAVMCEKPVAGCVDDADAMTAARDRHKLPLAIGYQDMYDPATMVIKKAIQTGQIGKVQWATVWATWPRSDKYYARADWAGAFKKGDVWVMDSPAHNALAHYTNLPLFWLGPTLHEAAQPLSVQAELYRVNAIQNYDTLSMRLTLDGGVTLLVLLTHACQKMNHPRIAIQGSAGKINWRFDGPISIDGQALRLDLRRDPKPHTHMVRRFTTYLRGESDADIALATMETSRPQVVAINGASEAAAVRHVPEENVTTFEDKNGRTRALVGIEEVFAHCAAERLMLHESGKLKWTAAGGERDLRGYSHYAGPRV